MRKAIPKIFRKILYRGYVRLNHLIGFTEKFGIKNPDAPLPFKPVFIIGPPRTGSTLLYQCLTTRYKFAYLSNLHCLMFGAPWLVEYLTHPSEHYPGSNFSSDHGSTRGLYSPSECGEFWYRFFRRHPQYIPTEEADSNNMKKMRYAFHALLKAGQKPYIFKNLPCALRIGPLHQTLPESVFIVINRDELDTAQSILLSREKKFGDYSTWYSLEPPEIKALKKEPIHIQATEQVRSIYKLIKRYEDTIGSEYFHHVSYQDLCRDPEQTCQNIRDFLRDHQINLADRYELPEYFQAQSKTQKVNESLYQQMKFYADKTK